MKKVEAIIRPEKVAVEALAQAGFIGLNVVQVQGRGRQKGLVHEGRGGISVRVDLLPKTKLEMVVKDEDAERVVTIIMDHARTGNIGDGKIFVIPVTDAIRVRTGERGNAGV